MIMAATGWAKAREQQAARGDILTGRDDRVADRFRAGVDESAGTGLGTMTDQRRAAAEEKYRDLPGRIAGIDHGQCEQRATERPDHGVDRIPDRIEPQNLVREKFRQCPQRADGQDPGIGESVEQLQMFGQADPAQPHCQAGDEHRQIEPPAGNQADATGQPQ